MELMIISMMFVLHGMKLNSNVYNTCVGTCQPSLFTVCIVAYFVLIITSAGAGNLIRLKNNKQITIGKTVIIGNIMVGWGLYVN